MTTTESPFRLEIELLAPERLPALARVFEALQRVKAAQFEEAEAEGAASEWIEDDDPRWEAWLDDAARAHFAAVFDDESEEGRLHAALWAQATPEERREPLFNVPGPWPYAAVIGAIYRHEYLLVSLTQVDARRAVLVYDPLAGPFGGTEALVQLVEGFGQRVTFDGWHEGEPYRPIVGWDPAEARRRLARG